MQQSRVEPYVGTSSSRRAASAHVAPGTLFVNGAADDQYTVAFAADTERTIDIPIHANPIHDGADAEPTLTYDIVVNRPPAEVQVGATLRERYVLHRLIGTGGTCRVFLAEDLHRRFSPEAAGELIALKVLRPGLGHGAYSLQRLRREFLQMQQLTHASIARVFDLDCDGDVWFMTMELVDAPSALTWMNGDYSNAEALRLIISCCDAVDHAHRKGIVHGDLKPGNVLVLADGGVKLIDFGSAATDGESAAEATKLEATPQYASPAVLAGNMAELRDDVFSLGCLAYMILARGKHPFDRRPSSEAAAAQLRAPYIPGIPLRLFEVVARALAWDPAQRQGSVRELQHALLASELTRTQPSAPQSMPGAATAVRSGHDGHEAMPAQTDAAHAKTIIRSTPPPDASAAAPHKEKPANTPGDYSYLNQFRGYVAGPMVDTKPPRETLAEELQGLEARLPPKAAAPTVFVPQPSYSPATFAPAPPQREPSIGQPPPRPSSRAKHVLVGAVGLSLLVAAGFGTARWSRPAPTPEVTALVAPAVSPPAVTPLVVTLATPEFAPLALPRLRAPSVRIAAIKAVKPVKAKPARRGAAPAGLAATRSDPAARVSFASRAVDVSPNQTLVAIRIRRSDSDRGAARVAWQIEGGSGPKLLDAKRAGAQVIQFHAGQAERTLYVPLSKEAGELAADGLRTFSVKLRQVDDGPSPGRVPEIRVTLLD